MSFTEQLRFTLAALGAKRLHAALTGLGIAVGIAAIILLSSLGAGLQRFVLAEFTQFGAHLIAIKPGKVQTMGASLGSLGSERLLTLEDAEALRQLPQVSAVTPLLQGNAEVRASGRIRRITVYGVGSDMDRVFRLRLQQGRFLPSEEAKSARSLAVLGYKARQELFPAQEEALGQRVLIGNLPARVVGVMEPKGQMLGFDMDDTLYIPAQRALDLFEREGLMEIDVLYHERFEAQAVATALGRMLQQRHGQEDFTIITQQQMLSVLGSVLGMLTVAVAALGGISLLVGSVGVFTVMTIAVRERSAEIGLLRALGATKQRILSLFLIEATMLAALGGLAGLTTGWLSAAMLRFFAPLLPIHTPWSFVLLAQLLAMGIGVLAGILPARQAANLDPLLALRGE